MNDFASPSWEAPTPEIKEVLEDIFSLAHLLKTGGQHRLDYQAHLLDARIKLLTLHKERMFLDEDRERADKTIAFMTSQKIAPPSFVPPSRNMTYEPVPVFKGFRS